MRISWQAFVSYVFSSVEFWNSLVIRSLSHALGYIEFCWRKSALSQEIGNQVKEGKIKKIKASIKQGRA